MKISNLGITNTPLTPQAPAGTSTASGEQASAAAGGASAYTPSSELTRLLDLVRQQSDIRPDQVQAAAQRLQQGDYHTAVAAEQTATAMLGALD